MATSELIRMQEVEKIARELANEKIARTEKTQQDTTLNEELGELVRLAKNIDKLPAKERKDRLAELQTYIIEIRDELKTNSKQHLENTTAQLNELSKKMDILLATLTSSDSYTTTHSPSYTPPSPPQPTSQLSKPEAKILIVCVITIIIVVIATTIH
jgi:small-conductance mechanosensitive channel